MLLRFLKGRRKKKPAPTPSAAVAVAAVPARPTGEVAAIPRPSTAILIESSASRATPGASALAVGDTRSMSSPEGMRLWLQRTIEQRCAELCDRVTDGSMHAVALVESIARPAKEVIRRPPLAAQRGLAIARDPNAAPSKLVKLIDGDPTLAQSLLRLANSAMYAPSGAPCVSITEAVRRVGAAGVETVVVRCMVEGLLSRPGGQYQEMSDLAWSHMVRTAPIGRALAPLFSVNPDEGYLLAMVHDVGKLVVFDHISGLRRSIKRQPAFPDHFVPTALRLLHEPLGGLAALEWGIGTKAAGAIASHHRFDDVPFAHQGSQLLFVAERAELAHTRHEAMNVEEWAEDGRLFVDPKSIGIALSEIPEKDWSSSPVRAAN